MRENPTHPAGRRAVTHTTVSPTTTARSRPVGVMVTTMRSPGCSRSRARSTRGGGIHLAHRGPRAATQRLGSGHGITGVPLVPPLEVRTLAGRARSGSRGDQRQHGHRLTITGARHAFTVKSTHPHRDTGHRWPPPACARAARIAGCRTRHHPPALPPRLRRATWPVWLERGPVAWRMARLPWGLQRASPGALVGSPSPGARSRRQPPPHQPRPLYAAENWTPDARGLLMLLRNFPRRRHRPVQFAQTWWGRRRCAPNDAIRRSRRPRTAPAGCGAAGCAMVGRGISRPWGMRRRLLCDHVPLAGMYPPPSASPVMEMRQVAARAPRATRQSRCSPDSRRAACTPPQARRLAVVRARPGHARQGPPCSPVLRDPARPRSPATTSSRAP